MYYVIFIFIIFHGILNTVSSQLLEGDPCTLPNNITGKCMKLKDCPSAKDEFSNKKIAKACNISGRNSIICCPHPSISIQMCNKYGKDLSELQVYAIAGGTDAARQDFPHMAALGYGNKDNIRWQCGGSLISDRFILTAAHCLKSQFGDVKFVNLGDIVLNGSKSNQDFKIIRTIPHPDYKPPLSYHDLALIELDKSPEYTPYVKPACLHTEPTIDPGVLEASGWGLTEFDGNPAVTLQKVELELFTNEECTRSFKKNRRKLSEGILQDRQLCAGGKDKGRDTCQGDSGGPLQIYRFAEQLSGIIGVTSFGQACGIVNIPGVYTRVSYYVPWIESVVWPLL